MTSATNMTKTRAQAMQAGDNAQQGGDYYRAYYRELVTRHASRAESSRRLEALKAGRRRARRERWLKGLKSLAGVLVSQEAAS